MKKFSSNSLVSMGLAAFCVCLGGTGPAGAHIVLETPAAAAGSLYKAVLRVGHGCNGAPTSGLAVLMPPGFQGARPQPKAGWTLAVRREALATPYQSHGKTVTEDVVEIRWTAARPDVALPDSQFDEFVFIGSLPAQPGPLWFKVTQPCERGQNDWGQIPQEGTSTKGLKQPAVLLDVRPAVDAQHAH